jgi:hypothetical protein
LRTRPKRVERHALETARQLMAFGRCNLAENT